MKNKYKFSVVDIIGITVIFIVLVILIVPLIMKMASNYEFNNTKLRAETLLNAALTEYNNDVALGRTITTYCYRSDYGYPKTLNDSTTKSINIADKDISYYITVDANGNMISFVFADERYGIDLRENVNVKTIKSLEVTDTVTKEDAYLTINKCPYNSN